MKLKKLTKKNLSLKKRYKRVEKFLKKELSLKTKSKEYFESFKLLAHAIYVLEALDELNKENLIAFILFEDANMYINKLIKKPCKDNKEQALNFYIYNCFKDEENLNSKYTEKLKMYLLSENIIKKLN